MPRTLVNASNGKAYVFNGTSSYTSIGTLTDFFPNLSAGSCTIAFWMKNVNTSTKMQVMGIATTNSRAFLFTHNANVSDATSVGRVRVFFRDNDNTFHNAATTNTLSNISDGNFHHIAIVATPSSASYQFYYDGVAATTSVSGSSPVDNFTDITFPFALGAVNSQGVVGNYFTGSLDDVRLYTQALTADEIQSLFLWENIQRGLYRLFKMDTNQSNLGAVDSSDNKVNGTNTSITLETGAIPLYRNIAI